MVDGIPVKGHPLYVSWTNMLNRCYRESDRAYKNYGARGIHVDERWHHFKNFAKDMGPRPTKLHTIERVNNDVGYGPRNCVWATRTEQALNRRVFKNSKSGVTGVVQTKSGAWLATFGFEYEKFQVGRFRTKKEAAKARSEFVDLFRRDQEAARRLVEREHVSLISSTGIRGVTPHIDGGFIVRATVDGVRHYLGYFQTVEEAERARFEFLAK